MRSPWAAKAAPKARLLLAEGVGFKGSRIEGLWFRVPGLRYRSFRITIHMFLGVNIGFWGFGTVVLERGHCFMVFVQGLGL